MFTKLFCNAADHQSNQLLNQLICKFHYVVADQTVCHLLSIFTECYISPGFVSLPTNTILYMSLQINFENLFFPSEWGFLLYLLDIRFLSNSSLTLLSWPLSLGVLHPLYWWFTGPCGSGSTFSGCALESFLPLTFSEPLTSLSSAPSCFHFSCAGLENRGGETIWL